MTDKKPVDPYFPETEPDVLTFLTTQLLKSLEREDYLYKKLLEAGVLNDSDVEDLSRLADWQRIPSWDSPVRDKALAHLNYVLHSDQKNEDNDG